MTRRAAPAADPALDPNILFGALRDARGLILAVSGGPDSTALMALVAAWKERPPALVVTVDHRLRRESAEEAELVARNATSLGLPCRIMRAPEPYPGGNLQAWAREERYRCLAAAAEEAGFDAIVTAHHCDDQAETFLLRLARGSGVYGLAAMAAEATVEGKRLVRPLLSVSRESLVAVAGASGLAVMDDPSNRDEKFDRVRMRRLMPALAQEGLTAERLAETAARLQRAAAALDHYAAALLTEEFRADSFGVVEGSVRALAKAPEEVALRALALILTAAGGAQYSPRLDRLEALKAVVLAVGDEGRRRRTLNGAVLTVEAGRLSVRREWGRRGIPAVPAPAGAVLIWDRRFRLSVPARRESVTAAPLGSARRRLRSNAADSATIRTLPGLFSDTTLLAIPEGVAAVDGEPLAPFHAECLVAERLAGPRLHAS